MPKRLAEAPGHSNTPLHPHPHTPTYFPLIFTTSTPFYIDFVYIYMYGACEPPPPFGPDRAHSAPFGAKGPQYARICTFYTECHPVYPYNRSVYPWPQELPSIACRHCLPQVAAVC